ncbi:importin beta-related nuclear transport factor, partial [Reticulomyxa filosa]
KKKKKKKSFLEELILRVASDKSMEMKGPFVTKLNEVLIAIAKREWPHNWPNFISQVCDVSRKSEGVCMNSIRLLRLLSEEASENLGDLTHTAQQDLKNNLHKLIIQYFFFFFLEKKDRRENKFNKHHSKKKKTNKKKHYFFFFFFDFFFLLTKCFLLCQQIIKDLKTSKHKPTILLSNFF